MARPYVSLCFLAFVFLAATLSIAPQRTSAGATQDTTKEAREASGRPGAIDHRNTDAIARVPLADLEQRLDARLADLDRQRAALTALRDRVSSGEPLSEDDRAVVRQEFTRAAQARQHRQQPFFDGRGLLPDAAPPNRPRAAGRDSTFAWNNEVEARVLEFLAEARPDMLERLRKLKEEQPERYQATVAEHGWRLAAEARRWREDPEGFADRARMAESDRAARRIVSAAINRAKASAEAGEDAAPIWAAMREDLRPILREQLTTRLRAHSREVRRMHDRITEAERSLEEAQTNMDKHLAERIADILERAQAAARGEATLPWRDRGRRERPGRGEAPSTTDR